MWGRLGTEHVEWSKWGEMIWFGSFDFTNEVTNFKVFWRLNRKFKEVNYKFWLTLWFYCNKLARVSRTCTTFLFFLCFSKCSNNSDNFLKILLMLLISIKMVEMLQLGFIKVLWLFPCNIDYSLISSINPISWN